MATLVPTQPLQGALYHRLQAVIASSYSGLGPQNVQTSSYKPMIGRTFQKPLSGSSGQTPTIAGNPYR